MTSNLIYNPSRMNRLKAIILMLIFGSFSYSYAQTAKNQIGSTKGTGIKFIEGISFTPAGISQTTETSGREKQVGAEYAEVQKLQAQLQAVNKSEEGQIENISQIQFKYAMMLDVPVESLHNISLLEFIEKWTGTRYRLGGTNEEGIDCSALTGNLLMAVYGCSLPRTAREQYRATDHIKKKDLTEGDLVFFNTRGGVSHVGLYLDNHYFVHSSSSEGVTISSLDDPYFSKRFICGGRIDSN